MSEKELGHQVVDEDHKTQIPEESTPGDKKETYILKATEDMFDGIIVDPTGLPKDIPTFVQSLKISLEFRKSQNKKGVWLELPILVGQAQRQGSSQNEEESERGGQISNLNPSYICLMQLNMLHGIIFVSCM
ncbi:unnamed protein product [Sphagnum troendelagicum]|uniref:Pre-nudix hydrolase domain-containing protein n=1 Tax=Sphagnum troendelagicum TaxID=128251 RepID=A0ABP0U6N7_9BRYO